MVKCAQLGTFALAVLQTNKRALRQAVTVHRKLAATARSMEDEIRNVRRNANRNPEWWGDFSQLVKIEKLEFLSISRYKFKSRFWFDLNVQLTKIFPPFRISICIPTSISSLIFQGTGCACKENYAAQYRLLTNRAAKHVETSEVDTVQQHSLGRSRSHAQA